MKIKGVNVTTRVTSALGTLGGSAAKDVDGRATDLALGWSVALGSPYTFQTTLESEFKSDIFGERGILLGAVHGLVEGLYRRFINVDGKSREDAFLHSAESITGPISKTISKEGIIAVYDRLSAGDKAIFEKAYAATYPAAREIIAEIANESVIECTDSLNPYMHARGVAYMIDNCSTTARLGARKWAPRFDDLIDQVGYVALDQSQPLDPSLIDRFKSHVIHPVLAEVGKMRPAVDISVQWT